MGELDVSPLARFIPSKDRLEWIRWEARGRVSRFKLRYPSGSPLK